MGTDSQGVCLSAGELELTGKRPVQSAPLTEFLPANPTHPAGPQMKLEKLGHPLDPWSHLSGPVLTASLTSHPVADFRVFEIQHPSFRV